jgi:hypothetical protein
MASIQRKVGSLTLDFPAAFIGVQILAKGMEKLESLGHHPVLVSSLLLLGGFVLVAAFLPHWLEKHIPHVHALFHVAEGVAMNLSAVLLFEKGRVRIPMILAFVGLLYMVAGYLESRSPAEKERLAGPLLKGIAWSILAGGGILAGFTAWGDRDAWAFGASGFFILVGAVLLVNAPYLLRMGSKAGEPSVDLPEAGGN